MNREILFKNICNCEQNGLPIEFDKYVIYREKGITYLSFEIVNSNPYNDNIKEISFTIREKIDEEFNERVISFNQLDIPYNKNYIFSNIRIDSNTKYVQFELNEVFFNKYSFVDGRLFKNLPNDNRKPLFIKKYKKRSLVYAFVMAPLIIGSALAAYFGIKDYKENKPTVDVDNFSYHFLGDSADEHSPISITSYYGNKKNLVIPSTLKNHPIVGVERSAFSSTNIKSIYFENDVYIERSAFKNCYNLEDVNFQNVTRVGDDAFYGCENLKYVNSSKIESIGDNAFAKCKNLKEVRINTLGQINIGYHAFSHIDHLNTFEITSNYNLYYSNYDFLCNTKAVDNLHLSNLNQGSDNSYKLFELFEDNYVDINNVTIDYMNVIPDRFALNMYGLKNISIGWLVDDVIGDYAFDYCNNLESFNVKTQYGIHKIGENAFKETKIDYFDLSTATYIGDNAFAFCPNLNFKTLSNNIEYLGSNAFSNCTSLSDVSIPKRISTIPDSLFENCINLRNVSFENESNCSTIGTNAFKGCSNLKYINLPSKVQSIGDSAFYDCSNLNDVYISSTLDLTSVGNYAFAYCSSLEKFPLRDAINLTSLGSGAFVECRGLTEVDLSYLKNVTLQSELFRDCSQLTDVKIPDTMVDLPNDFFNGCQNLTSVNLTNIESIGSYALSNCEKLDIFSFSPNLRYIGDEAFKNCYGMTKIVLTDKVTNIGYHAFNNCYNLVDLEIPFIGSTQSNPSTMQYLFSDYSNSSYQLVNIIVTNQSNLYRDTFNGFPNLKNITISDTLNSKELPIIRDCYNLESLTIPFVGSSISGKEKFAENIYNMNTLSSLATVNITSAKTIYEYAFDGCSYLQTINLNDSIDSIERYAFLRCEGLMDLHLPASIQEIPSDMIKYCNSLVELKFPEGVTTISSDAVSYCSNLECVYFPSSLASNYCNFNNCKRLFEVYNLSSAYINNNQIRNLVEIHTSLEEPRITTAYIDEMMFAATSDGLVLVYSDNDYSTFTFPETVEVDGTNYEEYRLNNYLFENKKNIETVNIGKGPKNISNYMFRYSNVKNVNFLQDSNITSIGEYAFDSCTYLNNFIVPDTVTTIGNYAFSYCENLERFTVGKNVNSIGSSAFDSTPIIEVINLSKLEIGLDENYGGIGSNALAILKSTSEERVESEDIIGYRYLFYKDACYLSKPISYIGSDVILPELVVHDKKEFNSYTIRKKAFKDYDIYSITIPKAVINIEERAFDNCYNLKNVYFNKDSQIESLPEYCFYNCDSLETFVCPDSLKLIDSYAFSSCNKLVQITLNKGLTKINNYAFNDCSRLYLVTNLSALTLKKQSNENGQVAAYAKLITSDKTINVEPLVYKELNFMKIGDQFYLTQTYFNGDLKLPESIVYEGNTIEQYSIDRDAFKNSSVTSVYIPKAVKEIGMDSFAYCDDLYKVEFAADSPITTIPKEAFRYSRSLFKVILPRKLTTIDEYAFAQTGLFEIKLPSSLSKIGDFAFEYCYNLTKLINLSSLKFTKKDPNDLTKLSENLTEIVTNPKENEIEIYEDNTLLYKLDGDSLILIDIPDYDFMLYRSVTITKDDVATTFDTYEIDLKSINYGINRLYIPKSVTKISPDSFGHLNSLKEVCYEGTKEEFDAIYTGDKSNFTIIYEDDGTNFYH